MQGAATGHNNVVIGQNAGMAMTTASYNVALGNGALAATTNGGRHVAIGVGAGDNVGAVDCTINIGNNADRTTGGHGCINATMYAPSFNNDSDCRYKCNIKNSDLGLTFIQALKPRKFQLKEPRDIIDEDGNLIKEGDSQGKKRQKETIYGLVAQEVAAALKECGKNDPHWDFGGYDDAEVVMGKKAGTREQQENEPDKYWWPGHHDYDPEHSSGIYQKTLGLSYTDFISPMIKAIQELSAKVEKLEKA